MIDPNDLAGGAKGVDQGPEEVEDSADFEFAAQGGDGFHCWMPASGEEEGDADFFEGGFGFFDGGGEVYAESFEDVCGADFAGGRAVAMLGNGDACCCCDEADSGGNIEGAGAVSACAAGVDARGWQGEVCGGAAEGLALHYAGHACEFFAGNAFALDGGEDRKSVE